MAKHTRKSTGDVSYAELLNVISDLAFIASKTATLLEEESPGLRECGYWNTAEKQAYEHAKTILRNHNRICPSDGEGDETIAYTNCGEGPFSTQQDAKDFAEAEVGCLWFVCEIEGKYHVMTRGK